MKRMLAGLVLLLCCTGATARTYTMQVTEAEIQERAEAMMPLEKQRFFITAILRHPVIDLIGATNRIALTADVELRAPGSVSGAGRVTFSGSLRYEAESGSFHFDNLNVEALEVAGLGDKHIPKATKLLEYVATRFLARKPVFTFKDDDVKHQMARASLKSVQVEGDALTVELGI